MAEVTVPASTRIDEQLVPVKARLPIGKCNLIMDLQKMQKNLIFRISMDILQNTNFFSAFTASVDVPSIYIQQFWNTLTMDTKSGITPKDSAQPFVAPPAGDLVIDFINNLGYPKEIQFVSKMYVNSLYQLWRTILTMINQCLTGKTSMYDRPRHQILQILLKVPSKKLKPHVIPYCRFTKLIICYLGGQVDEVFGMPISNDLIIDVIRNSEYYQRYLEMAARKPTAKEGGKKKTTSKAEMPKKPAPAKQSKPSKEKTPSLLPQRKSARAPLGRVAIREPASVTTQKLLLVEGKGKGIATDEQVALSLLDLQKPKKKSISDQYILQRRTPVTQGASTRPSTQPLDDTSVNLVQDTLSPADSTNVAETYADVEPTDSDTQTEILNIAKERDNPLSSFGTLSSMKNLDDACTFGDQFLNDKSMEDAPRKANMEAEVVSMVILPIHQASSSVPPLSTPVINLSPPKSVLPPVVTATAATTPTTLPPPPPMQSTTDPELANHVSTLEKRSATLSRNSNSRIRQLNRGVHGAARFG
ncbi:hypothetical protein Tco_0509048 [Tanacetum coccineum]